MILVRACTIYFCIPSLSYSFVHMCVCMHFSNMCNHTGGALPGVCTSRLHTNRGCETVPIKTRFFEVFYATVKFWYFIPRVRINWYFRTERFYRETEKSKNRKRSKFLYPCEYFQKRRDFRFFLYREFILFLFFFCSIHLPTLVCACNLSIVRTIPYLT